MSNKFKILFYKSNDNIHEIFFDIVDKEDIYYKYKDYIFKLVNEYKNSQYKEVLYECLVDQQDTINILIFNYNIEVGKIYIKVETEIEQRDDLLDILSKF
uniref:Uncharacterized protein n=1 Tax=Pithovirus LCDPAC02 TaxID=2506601 RepID=A0A481YN94_9VIRU|nr:MAG: hypothetical protein LCDPAC02_00120 [Pithovirus LCDPAC02]